MGPKYVGDYWDGGVTDSLEIGLRPFPRVLPCQIWSF